MKLAVLLGVLVFGLSLVAKAQAPIHAYKNMDEANADIQKFTQEIAINSKDAKLLCSRGDAYAFVAKWQEATADYTAAIEIDPQYAPAYLGRGWVNYGNRNFKDAVASLTEAIKLKPDYGDAYRMRGEANFDHLDQAISDLTEAVKLNPNDHEAYFELGNMFNNRADLNKSPADYDKAISALTSAIKLKPDNFCYNQRGIAYLGKGDYQNAIADFKDEHDDTSACNMGAAHFALGDYQQAINDYESGGMFGEPNHEGIAEANYALGNLNEALKNFRASASEGWGLNQVGGISFSRRPFFYVWLIEVEQSQDIQQANKNLSDGLLTHSEYKFDDCMPEIGDYLLNHVSEANLLSKINDAGSKNFDQSKSEAMFFVGMKHLLSSDPIGAKTFFQICVDRGEKAFNGYQFSKARLAHLARDGK